MLLGVYFDFAINCYLIDAIIGLPISYVDGRGVAAFDGRHGWFFRNRTNADVTLTLRTRGDYTELVRTA